MSFNLEPKNENVRRVARELCAQSNRTPDYGFSIQDGFEVPGWLFYVSEAQKLWLQHIATNGLDWNGKKARPR